MDEDVEMPLTIGIPFLATSQAHNDVSDGRMVLRVGDEEETFRLLKAMEHSVDYDHTCYFIDIIDVIIFEHI